MYCLTLVSLVETRPSPTNLHAITWAVGLSLEIVHLIASSALYSTVHQEGKTFYPYGGRLQDGFSDWEKLEVLTYLCRLCLLFLLLASYHAFLFLRHIKSKAEVSSNPKKGDEKTRQLNHPSAENGYPNGHGSKGKDTEAQHVEQAGWVRPEKLPSVTWWHYITSYSIFLPYLWPSDSPELKTRFFFCVVLLVAARAVNVLVPYQVGKVTDLLTAQQEHLQKAETGSILGIPWAAISKLVLYRFLQGNSGVLNNLRQALWIPIGQYSSRELAVAIFGHVHKLSLDFHVDKKTGEVISAMNKGGSINTFLDTITFHLAPLIVDLIVAMVYFAYAFDVYYTLVMIVVSFWYMYLTAHLAHRRADVKREVTNLGRQEEAVK